MTPAAARPPAGLRAARRTPHTRYQYERICARFAAFQGAHPDSPLAEQIAAFLASVRAPVMALFIRKALKAKYRREVDWDEMPRVRAFRDEARLYRGLWNRETDWPRLLAVLRTPRERAMVELFWTLRRIEVVWLRWADLDLARGLVSVFGKGGKRAVTLLAPDAVPALRAWRAERPAPDAAYVFPNPSGGPLGVERISRILRASLRRAGLYQVWRGAHSFRRSFASGYLRENPGDLLGLKRLMRHEDVSATALYVFFDHDELAPRFARVFAPRDGGQP